MNESTLYRRFAATLIVALLASVAGETRGQATSRLGAPSATPPSAPGSRFQLPSETRPSDRVPSTGDAGIGSGERIPPATERLPSNARPGSATPPAGGSIFDRPSATIPSTSPAGSSLGTPSAIPRTAPPATAPSGSGSLPFDEPLPGPRSDIDARDEAPEVGSRSGDAVSMSGIETQGYALVGPVAHHYIFGSLAIADYVRLGQRRIVSLEEETNLPKADPNFLYYRELRDGHRWAIATKASQDRRYSIYFQPTGQASPVWRRVQGAELQWPRAIGGQSMAAAAARP